MDLYPDIRIEMVVDDRELDLSMREADVAIRMWKPTQADLVYRKLITVHNHIYAAVDYIARYGAPQTIEDMDSNPLIVYGEEAPAHSIGRAAGWGRGWQNGLIWGGACTTKNK